MIIVLQQSCELPLLNKREILRYAGVRGTAEEVESMLDNCINEMMPSLLSGKVCWCKIGIEKARKISEIKTMLDSKSLSSHIDACREIVLFAATVGIEIDRAITRYNAISPVKALLGSAIGSERIEALCDTFEDYLRNTGNEILPRFSPGSADLPLECQRDIFALLDCSRQIGLTLNQRMVMSPSKSVSAIIGIK